ncbi:MAG: zinc-ribbon domain-containing protein [Lachnospiraceae bacterium]|nr:zinc-ribbon domain-containing protein [Lachnospiraceae bacterium]
MVKKGGWICYNCPSCGSEIEPTDKFCNVCGYKLKTEE